MPEVRESCSKQVACRKTSGGRTVLAVQRVESQRTASQMAKAWAGKDVRLSIILRAPEQGRAWLAGVWRVVVTWRPCGKWALAGFARWVFWLRTLNGRPRRRLPFAKALEDGETTHLETSLTCVFTGVIFGCLLLRRAWKIYAGQSAHCCRSIFYSSYEMPT